MVQPEIKKKSTVKTLIINFLINIIPFGILYVLIMAIIETTRTKMPIYRNEPVKVRDRRYKVGYRIDGWNRKKTGAKRELTEEEINAFKHNGRLRFYSIILFFVVGGILYYFEPNIK